MSADLIDLVQRMGQPRVLVIGDVMLDRYVWGDAERISQEAPVILLHADKREERLGGGRRGGPKLPAPRGGGREAGRGKGGKFGGGGLLKKKKKNNGIDHHSRQKIIRYICAR